jgi:RNA 2',3'-cyclic 3'-phosphodiesterase
MTNTKRLFFAAHIDVPDLFNMLIPELKQKLGHERISWTRKGQSHITLRFLGDTHVNHIPRLEKAFSDAVSKEDAFEISIEKVKIFGSRYKPTVIWIGAEDGGDMKHLFARVRHELEKIGLPGDRQNFVPHLTLGRIRELTDLNHFQRVLNECADYQAGKNIVSELILYESRLEKTGAVHIPLKKFALNQI